MVAGETVALRSYADRIDEYVEVAPAELALVERAAARGKGIVFAASHIGNWELLARRLSRHIQPNAVIAKRSWNRKIDDMVERHGPLPPARERTTR